MERRPGPTVVDAATARRVDQLDAAFRRLLLEHAAADGNPLGLDFFYRGAVMAAASELRPDDPFLNRAVELGPDDLEHVPPLVSWYRRKGVWPWFVVSPGDGASALLDALAAEGAWPVSFTHVAVGPVLPPPPDRRDVRVEPVDGDTLGLFMATLAESHGHDPAAGEGPLGGPWLRVPGLVALLARIDGEPAGAAALLARDGLALLADAGTRLAQRGRGVGEALLAERVRRAGDLGADVVAGACRFGSDTHLTLQRAGLVSGYTRAVLHLGG